MRGKGIGDAGLEEVVLVAYGGGAEKYPVCPLLKNRGTTSEEKSGVRRLRAMPVTEYECPVPQNIVELFASF